MNFKKPNPFDKFLRAEDHEHVKFVEYLNWQHKTTLWFHTPNEGNKTPFERYLHSKMGAKKGVSDFVFILGNKKYNGLVIELKQEGTKLYKANGTCYFPEQEDFIKKAIANRFYGTFCCGFEEAKKMLERYIANEI